MELRFHVDTQADGSFVFDKAPPVASQVRAFLHFSVKSALQASRSVPLDLKPGEAVDVALGGGGAELTGQLVVEDAPAGFDYHFSMSYLVARRPGIEPPSSIAAKGLDWRRGWSDSWKNAGEGQAYLATLHNWFVKPEPNGHFSVSGLEPGDYQFAVNLYGSTEGCLVHPRATGLIPITVKPGQTRVDLGAIVIPSIPLTKMGDLAPDFAFTGVDGTKTSLSALKGETVLLDFWATWCRPCVTQLEAVEGLRKKYGVSSKLTVIGVNLDAQTARAREFLNQKSLPWQHALLGDWSSTDVPRNYSISTIPAYVLIGPDGKIVAQEYSLERLEEKLKSLKSE